MNKANASFLLMVAFLATLPLALNQLTTPAIFPAILTYGIAGLGALCLFLDGQLHKAEKKRPAQYVASFMGTTAVKLFATIIFIGVVLFLNKPWPKSYKVTFAIGMFVAYMAFLFFQIVQHNKRLKRNKASKEQGAD